jgi:enterochelin esterase-like enzyme
LSAKIVPAQVMMGLVNGELTFDQGPVVSAGSVTFRLPDQGQDGRPTLAGVRLLPALSLPDTPLQFEHADGVWTLILSRPPVWRMEYRFQLRHQDNGLEEICDPGNGLRAPGAFGDKSVVEFPDYRAPSWLTAKRIPSDYRDLEGTAVRLWFPADAEPAEPLPLLVAHDGPEYDRLASLTAYSGALIEAGTLPRHRVALLAPGHRDDEYSANPTYTRALAQQVLPAIRATVRVDKPVVGMGASLGGLAMLHAQRRRPSLFGGLFLQSASFLDTRLDPQERWFSRFTRVSRFVTSTVRGTTRGKPVPVTLTCGLAEENLANNRQMSAALGAQGYSMGLVEIPDAHNYVGWRDAVDPALTELLRTVWEG